MEIRVFSSWGDTPESRFAANHFVKGPILTTGKFLPFPCQRLLNRLAWSRVRVWPLRVNRVILRRVHPHSVRLNHLCCIFCGEILVGVCVVDLAYAECGSCSGILRLKGAFLSPEGPVFAAA